MGGYLGNSLPFSLRPFTPLQPPSRSPSIPVGKRCLQHYSKLLGVAICMGWSVEGNRKAITLNSNRRPRGGSSSTGFPFHESTVSSLSPHLFPSLLHFFLHSEHHWHVTDVFLCPFACPLACQEQISATN